MGVTARWGPFKRGLCYIATICISPHAGWDDLYQYTADLLTLNFCQPEVSHGIEELMYVYTPLDADVWEAALVPHPDRVYAGYIIQGLRKGLIIGFHGELLLDPPHPTCLLQGFGQGL